MFLLGKRYHVSKITFFFEKANCTELSFQKILQRSWLGPSKHVEDICGGK